MSSIGCILMKCVGEGGCVTMATLLIYPSLLMISLYVCKYLLLTSSICLSEV